MKKLLVLTVTTASMIGVTSIVAVAGSAATPQRSPDPAAAARGVVLDGLRPVAAGACRGGFEVEVASSTYCSHGPDAAPGGVDVREPRSVAELRLATLALPTVANPHAAERAPVGGADEPADGHHVHADGSVHDHGFAAATSVDGATATEPGVIPVIGDGVSGKRVQVVYAVAEDRADRYDEIAPLIANWSAHIDAMLDASAAMTGGERHVRYVTNPDGALSVLKVVLPADGDDSFGYTIRAMENLGHYSPDRKYLMWVDAGLYCGIGTLSNDDRPTADNRNNGSIASYARIDTGCWGFENSVELHELVHTLGGVQQSAAHSTPGFHCTDEYDRMCYRDSADVVMTYDCDISMEAYLDCGHDDYFHSSPAPGSYLDTHWNVANSGFLHAGPVTGDPPPPPPPVNGAPSVSASAPGAALVGEVVPLDGSVSDDGLPGPYTVSWSVLSGPPGASFADAASEDTSVVFSAAGTYQLVLAADDGELTGVASTSVSVTEPAPVNEAPSVSASAPTIAEAGAPVPLDGTVLDDGLPGPYTVSWSVLSGPSGVSFADALSEDTMVTLPSAGTYVLGLTADDGELSGSATVSIDVPEPEPPPPTNKAPQVSASGPASTLLGDGVLLNGAVSDDGLPRPYTVSWTQASGPDAAVFASPGSEDTLVSFPVAGAYTLVLTADDGELSASASVTVVVEQPAPPTETTEILTGSLNKKWTSRSFAVVVGDGPIHVAVAGGDTGGRGKKGKSATPAELTVRILDQSGDALTISTGAGSFEVSADVTAGTYTLEVSGPPTSFELTVTYLTAL